MCSVQSGAVGTGSQREVQVEVRTVSDIDRDYALVRTKLSLLKRDPSMATQIYSELCVWLHQHTHTHTHSHTHTHTNNKCAKF